MQNKLFFSWLLSIVVLVVLMACSTQNDINPSLNMPSKEEDISSKSENENLIVEASYQSAKFSQSSSQSLNPGIHVTGSGSVSLEPDLANMKFHWRRILEIYTIWARQTIGKLCVLYI